MSKAFLRSDEAGWYHNNELIPAVCVIGYRVGVKVVRYDLSEPQYGKDVCDRILYPMKESIRRYCNEGHDIVQVKDMREALQKQPVKGTTSSVNIVNTENKTVEMVKLKGFSSFHNFQYEESGIRIWKAFSVGKGQLVPYSSLFLKHQGPTNFSFVEDQSFLQHSLARSLRHNQTRSQNCLLKVNQKFEFMNAQSQDADS